MSSWARVGGAWSLNPEPAGAFFSVSAKEPEEYLVNLLLGQRTGVEGRRQSRSLFIGYFSLYLAPTCYGSVTVSYLRFLPA